MQPPRDRRLLRRVMRDIDSICGKEQEFAETLFGDRCVVENRAKNQRRGLTAFTLRYIMHYRQFFAEEVVGSVDTADGPRGASSLTPQEAAAEKALFNEMASTITTHLRSDVYW